MAEEDANQGESSSRLSLKSGRERTAGSDHKRIYVKWPQEACFIGPDWRRVKYDDLTQSQWTAGLTAIAAEEPNPVIQRNMLQYLAALHQDVVDFSFNVALGSHAIILTYLEEGRVTWDDLPLIQALRESYSYRSQASASSKPNNGQPSKTRLEPSKRRICRNYNSGTCTRESSHVNNGTYYDHHCSFCIIKGYKFSHPETTCNKKPAGSGVTNPT